MTYELRLPDLGEGIAEAELHKWLVAAGDVVAEHQAVAEVETDKALVELPSPVAGKVLSLQAAEGETVAVGAVLLTLETAVRGGSKAPSGPPPTASSASSPKRRRKRSPRPRCRRCRGCASWPVSAASNWRA